MPWAGRYPPAPPAAPREQQALPEAIGAVALPQRRWLAVQRKEALARRPPHESRRLIERGVRFVTVNMFETVFDEVTWDIHGSRPFTDIAQMSREVVPNFDRAYSALIEDLTERGLYSNTIVTAMGEFGRTPKINPAGGRDHHPGVWTILMGGGPIRGGRIVGESDELGYRPKSRPVTTGEVAATLFRGLGLDVHRELPGPQNRPLPLVDFGVQAIRELF